MKEDDKFEFPAEEEPDGEVIAPHHAYSGALIMLFGFMLVWPTYPAMGAGMSVLGLLIAADDVISHVFGVWTPLDWAWKVFLKWYRNR